MTNILYKTWKRNSLKIFFFFCFLLWIVTLVLLFNRAAAVAAEPTKVFPKRSTAHRVIESQAITYREDFVSSTTTTTAPKPVDIGAPSSVVVSPPSITPSETKYQWLIEAGIDPSDWTYVVLILNGENANWDPCKRYGGISDCTYEGPLAYGIPQALPGAKMAGAGADWKTNPVTQLKWMDMYCNQEKFPQAKSAYKNWAEAYQHKMNTGWY